MSVEEVKDEYELSFPGLRFFSFPRIRFHGPEIRGNPQEKLQHEVAREHASPDCNDEQS